jgi:hypothetical protein
MAAPLPGVRAARDSRLPTVVRYVVSMFEHAHQIPMMALVPGPFGVH